MLQPPNEGFFSSTAYTASSLPWVTTSSTSGTDVINYSLPRVSKCITVINNASSTGSFLRIGFTANGIIGTNYYNVPGAGGWVTLDVRVKEVFVRAHASGTIPFSLFCGLTLIDPEQMPMLTGTLTSSAGSSPGWSGVG
jgi:hypothetical protein